MILWTPTVPRIGVLTLTDPRRGDLTLTVTGPHGVELSQKLPLTRIPDPNRPTSSTWDLHLNRPMRRRFFKTDINAYSWP